MNTEPMFDAGDFLPPVYHVFGPCQREQHQVCGRSYRGCGWDGHKSNPAPMHYCTCECHRTCA